MATNVRFIRTSKEKQNNRQLTNQFDHSALYFVTDSRQLYRADQLLTSGIRIVDSYQALPDLEGAAEEILYFTKAQGNGYTLQADRSGWLLVFESNKSFLDQLADTYVTKEAFDARIGDIEEAIAAIQHPTVDLNGYATETYVDNKVAEINVPDKVSDLENDLGYLTEHQDISHLATTEYLTTELGGKADKEHEHSQYLTKHQDLTDYAKKSDIPDISGKADISHTHQEYLTELPEHNHDDAYAKLNDISQLQSQVLFSENYYVTKPIGDFVLGQNVNTLTIRKLFETLLGLSTTEPSTPDEPDTPVQPEGIIEEIIVNKLPMYQLNENDELVEVAFVEPIKYKVEAAEVTAAIEEARLINDGQVGFYQVVSGTGEVVESGYQDITESKEPWYIIALPESLEVTRSGNVELLTWDTTAKPPVWVEASYVLTSDYTEITTAYEDADLEPPVAPSGHKLWADLSESDPGTQYRFVIKDKE